MWTAGSCCKPDMPDNLCLLPHIKAKKKINFCTFFERILTSNLSTIY